jgi:hypothetical protein
VHALVTMLRALAGRLTPAAGGRGSSTSLGRRLSSGRGRRRGLSASRGAATGGAQGEDKIGIFAADVGADIIWLVVGGVAVRLAGRAVDGNAGWVVGVVLHGRNQRHATGREGVAVDVGDVVVDLAISPGELELGHVAVVLGRELDGHAIALVAPALRVAALHLLHLSVRALADGSVPDWGVAVVDDGGLTQGHGGRSKGEQHGCAGELGQRHCDVGGLLIELLLKECWTTRVSVAAKE